MIEDLVRRWQAGWSTSRGWGAVSEDDGVICVTIGERGRSVEYVVLDADHHPERVTRAADLAAEASTTSWVTVATGRAGETEEALERHGLRIADDPEWLMTIQLDDHPHRRLSAGYELVREPDSDVIVMRATKAGVVTSSGRMAVVGTDAVADRIETDPAHRRRGLGSAVMAALARASLDAGAERGILIASREGFGLYQALGWKVVADVVVARSR